MRSKFINTFLLFFTVLLTSCDVPFFKVVSSSFAKEFCSCLYVVGQTENYCKAYAKQIVPVSKYEVDHQKKWVQASGLGYQTTVTYLGEKEGCQIQ